MLEQKWAALRGQLTIAEESSIGARLRPIRAAAAQVLVATGASAALGELMPKDGSGQNDGPVPGPLALAPILVGSLAAAAQLEHARNPRPGTKSALRLTDAAVIGVGAAVFLVDIAVSRRLRVDQLAPLAFASTGLLGFMLRRYEERAIREERRLRRRANVVERLVPHRRPKLDRVVVHV